MSTELKLAWVSLGIGIISILAALPALFTQYTTVGIILIVVALILIGVFAWVYWLFRQPPYIITELRKSLTFQDPEGKRATSVRRGTIKSKQKELGHVRLGNLTADGPIENIRIDNKPIEEDPDAQKEVDGGVIYVTKFLRPPLARGDTRTIEFSYDLINAFKRDTESVIHRVAHKTKSVYMEVRFHPQTPCVSARAYLLYGGQIDEHLVKPKASNDGTLLRYHIKNPKRGREYKIE